MKPFTSICIIVLLLGGFLSSSAYTQESPIFDKYGDKPNVKSVYISKTMLEAQPDRYTKELKLDKVVGQLDAIYMVSVMLQDDTRKGMHADIERYIKNGKYEVLMKQKSTVSSSAIYIRKKGDKVKELIMVTDAGTLTFLQLYGEMTIKDLQNITSQQYSEINNFPILDIDRFFAVYGDMGDFVSFFRPIQELSHNYEWIMGSEF